MKKRGTARREECVIIDAQVHAYARNSAEFPWSGAWDNPEPPIVTGEDTLAVLDASGVDGAILVSTFRAYGDDTRYAESVFRAHPDSFRLVAPINPTRPDAGERVQQWAATPGAAGVRILIFPTGAFDIGGAGLRALMREARAKNLPVNVACWGRLADMDELAAAFPDVQLVLDHLGLWQQGHPPAPAEPFADLDQVLALARFPHVAIKLTGMCAYTHCPFPYEDLWAPVGRVIDAFGPARTMWGTDWQRTTRWLSHEQATRAFRDHWPLPASDKAAIMGETAMRLYRWSETGARR